MKLRPYETDWSRRIIEQQKRKVLAVGPTGCGKTVVAANVIRKERELGNRVLFLAHRRELIQQAKQRLIERGVPAFDIGIIMAGEPRNPDALVQVASVQTLAKREKLPRAQLVVLDEAHHATSSTYLRIVEAYGKAKILGLTATPYRLDGRPLGDVFDVIVEGEKPSRLIADGFLSMPRVYSVPQQDRAKLENVRSRGGDFASDDLDRAVRKPKLLGSIVEHWKRLAERRPTVCYSVSIKHGEEIRKAFKRAGVSVRLITGSTDVTERDAALQGLTDGTVQVVVNCMVLTEGWDCPAARCAIIARPTQSLTLWLQMCGRVMRPGEVTPLILDHSGNAVRLGLPGTDLEFSLEQAQRSPRELALREKTCPECDASVALQCRTCPNCGHEFWIREPPEEVTGYLKLLESGDPWWWQEAKKLYESGMSCRAIAEKLGANKQAVNGALHRLGVRMRTISEAQGGLTDEQALLAKKLYESGMSCRAIAEKLGVSEDAVWRALRRLGVRMRTISEAQGGLTDEQALLAKKAKKLYESGMSCRAIAEKLGANKQAVNGALHRLGVRMRTISEAQGGLTDEQALLAKKAKKLYESGMSYRAIAEKLGVSNKAVRRALHRLGVRMRTISEALSIRYASAAE